MDSHWISLHTPDPQRYGGHEENIRIRWVLVSKHDLDLDIPHDVDYILVQLAVMGAHLVLDQNRSKLMNGYNLIMPAARRRARVTTGDEFMQICAGI
jgi:hypothetical protein